MAENDAVDWRKRLKIPALVIGTLLVLYAVIGFWGLPYLIKSKLPELVNENLDREGSIQQIEINPFLFTISLQGLEIKKKDGGKFVAFDELFVDFETSSLFKKAVYFDAIRLSGIFVDVDILKNGKLNFDDLLQSEEPAKEPEQEDDGPFPVIISKLDIEKGVIVFDDFSVKTPFHTSIEPINLAVKNFTTHLDSDSGYQFSAAFSEGGNIDWQGSLTMTPMHSAGHIQLAEFRPLLIWEYIQDQVKFKITDGTYDFSADYAFSMAGGEPQLEITKGNYKLNEFKLSEKGVDSPVIDIPVVELDAINVSLAKKQVNIQTVSSQDAKIEAWVNQNKSLNFQELFQPNESSSGSSPSTNASAGANANTSASAGTAKPTSGLAPDADSADAAWLVKIQNIAFKNYDVKFQDRSLATTMTLDFTPLTITLDNFSSDLNGQLPFTIDSAVNKSGHLKVKGALGLDPVSTDVDLDLKLNLTDFQPYIDPATKLEFGSGMANVKGKVDFKLDEQSKPQLAFNGSASIDEFVGQDKIEKKKLFDWKALRFDGVDFNLDPIVVNIEDVTADTAYARFIINPDGSTNISKVFASGSDTESAKNAEKVPATADAKPKAGGGPDAQVNIETVTIKDTSAMFADNSLKPNFSTGLTRLNGTIKGLSTDKKSKAAVSLKGRADKTAPVHIKGKMNVFSPDGYTDISMDFKNLSLTSLTPYSGKFAGRKIEKGKMAVDLKYKLNSRKLNAQNKIVLDQLTLGDEVDSPDAVSLPLSLAIALLKDSNGVIKIDLPLKGSLDDPEFSIWGLIGDVLVNLLTKIVTSPFAALGSLVEGGEELGNVTFAAGQADLTDDQKTKLSQVIDALNQRPALNLEIEGIAGAGDIRAAAEKQFRDDIMKEKKAALKQAAEDESSDMEITVTDEDFNRHLLKAYYMKLTGMKYLTADSPMVTQQLGNEEVVNAAREQVLNDVKVDHEKLRKLAQERAKNIHDYLIDQKLNADRIFLLDVNVESESKPDADLNTVVSRLSLKPG